MNRAHRMLCIVQAYGQSVSCIIGISNVSSSFSLLLYCVNSTNICQKKKKKVQQSGFQDSQCKHKANYPPTQSYFLRNQIFLNTPMFAFLFIYFSLIATVVKSLLVKILSIEQDHQHRLGACQKSRISGPSSTYRVRICI